MPLSDKEQEILQQIERQLTEEDPQFSRRVSSKLDGRSKRNLRLGIALFVVGFGVLIAFLALTQLLLGVASFLMMLAGAVLAFEAFRRFGAEGARNVREKAPLKRIFGPIEGRMRGFKRDGEK